MRSAGGKSIYRQLTFYETEGVKLKFSANSYGFNFFEVGEALGLSLILTFLQGIAPW
jgi:hypothetical protein